MKTESPSIVITNIFCICEFTIEAKIFVNYKNLQIPNFFEITT